MDQYKVLPISVHQYLEALKKHVTVHKYISTAVFIQGITSLGFFISLL